MTHNEVDQTVVKLDEQNPFFSTKQQFLVPRKNIWGVNGEKKFSTQKNKIKYGMYKLSRRNKNLVGRRSYFLHHLLQRYSILSQE